MLLEEKGERERKINPSTFLGSLDFKVKVLQVQRHEVCRNEEKNKKKKKGEKKEEVRGKRGTGTFSMEIVLVLGHDKGAKTKVKYGLKNLFYHTS